MTDFLAWWADHWPLIPFAAPVLLASLAYLWKLWVDRLYESPFYALKMMATRRREP